MGQDHRSNTEIVYDTVFVYDTIWTHETIYDTVWVYDTIFIDETINDINKMPANGTGLIGLPSSVQEPLELFPVQPVVDSLFIAPSLKQPVQATVPPAVRMKSDLYTPMWTLNPFRGKFDPSVFRDGEYSLEAYSGPVFQNITYNFSTSDSRDQAIKASTTATVGLEYGLRFSYHLDRLTIETGLGISQLRDNFNYTTTDLIIDSTTQTSEITRLVTFTDTIQFIDVDQLLQGDTVWTDYYYQYDSLVTYDSIYYESDTTTNSIIHQEIVTHYSLEIPVLLSWQWEYAKMKVGVKAGGINQIHLFSVGKAYSGYGEVGNIEDVVRFTRYNIALYGGLTCSCQLTEQISVGLDAFYKYSLRKFEERFNASIYRQTYGANVSVCYHFKKGKK